MSSSSIPVSIINLDKDETRWKNVTQEVTFKGIPWDRIERIPAVYGRNLLKDELQSNATFMARTFCTPGTIGCFLSHRSFWEKTASSSFPYQIVLEDDVVLSENFVGKLEVVLKELQENKDTRGYNWDVLLLGALGCVHPEGRHGINRLSAFFGGGSRTQIRVTEHCYVPKRPLGTHAYVLTKRGAQKLLNAAWKASGHVDVIAWGIQDLKLLCCDPMLVHQNMVSPSTISGVSNSIETQLPKFKLDEYTGITFEWLFSEPIICVPGLGMSLTLGRSVLWVIGGLCLGLALRDTQPWLLQAHAALVLTELAIFKSTTLPAGPRKIKHDHKM